MARLVLYAIRLDERWQRAGHSRQHRLVAVLLALFDLLPVVQHLFLGVGLLFAIDVRMAEYQLVCQRITYVGHVKLTFLLTYPRIESHMQQHVAQLLHDVVCIVSD